MIELWNTIILEPMINGLIVLCSGLFGNFGLAVIVLTIIVRLLTMPLTLKQLRSARAMSTLQPKLQELQKKYAKDKQKLQVEMMRLRKEAGVNPMGCLVPMLVQLPIWIALYQAIMRGLGNDPGTLLGLAPYLYSWSVIHQTIPVNETFLWLHLMQPDPYFLLPILVGGSMWVQQKMSMMPTTDPRQRSMNTTMLFMMPLMFAFLTLTFPSGLALYWVLSNIIGIGIQYFAVGGWGGLVAQPAPTPTGGKKAEIVTRVAEQPETIWASDQSSKQEEEGTIQHGGARDKRKDSRRRSAASSRSTRRKSGSGRDHRSQKR